MGRKNVGKSERFLRTILGIVLVLIGYFGTAGLTTYVLYFVGVLILLTGLSGWCPIFALSGYSSRATGLNRITRRDIERAVKEYTYEENSNSGNKIQVETIKPKKSKKKTTTKKKSVKKASEPKKTVVKKSPAKKKVVKKTTPKKKVATKKATKKTVTKKTTTTKKVVKKKAAPKKKVTTKKATSKKK